MAGYTRQSQNDIFTGNAIEAEHFNNEFDEIQAAFAVLGGHNHDGSVGGGAAITKVGTNNFFTLDDGIIRSTNNTSTYTLNNVADINMAGQISGLNVLDVGGSATIDGTLTASESVTFSSNSSSDSFNISIPTTNFNSSQFTIQNGSSKDVTINARTIDLNNQGTTGSIKNMKIGGNGNQNETADAFFEDVRGDSFNVSGTASGASSSNNGFHLDNYFSIYRDFSNNFNIADSNGTWIKFDSGFNSGTQIRGPIKLMDGTSTTNWELEVTNQYVYFSYNGQRRMRLDQQYGDLAISGFLTENASI